MNDQSANPLGIPVPVSWTQDGLAVRLLDQTLLPVEERFLRLETVEEVAEAISSLRVRGAPAIGIAAAMGLAVVTQRRLGETGATQWEAAFREDALLLRSTRPTAVNLAWAIDRLEGVFYLSAPGGPRAQVESLVREATAIALEDKEMCRRIGEFGLALLPPEGCGILTHCNAGALATGGMGTALAPVYAAHARGSLVRLFADETRPLLQGARLTAWEAGRAGIKTTVITDSMAGALMQRGEIDLVIVGADRVAANGDVANKIGTYGLAVLARHHGLPFFVALPRSTFDLSTPEGGLIPIEERTPEEVGVLAGTPLIPGGTRVWNPAFDVTPAHLVTAFITDGGVIRPPFGPAISHLFPGGPGEDGAETLNLE